MMRTHQHILADCALVALLALSGCGGKEEAEIAAPPSSTPAVSLTATPDPAAPVAGAPEAAVLTGAADGPPVREGNIPDDIFKGMTKEQIEEFKASSTPETHDTQIALISEAANTYWNEFKRAPADVEALVKAGHLPRVLKAPKGKKYIIDPMTLAVTSVNL